MQNLLSLFEEVIDTMDQLGIDAQDVLNGSADARLKAGAVRVVGAHQPHWPLAENVSHIKVMSVDGDEEDADEDCDGSDGYDDPDIEPSELSEMVCWIVLSGHPNDMSPYAPRTCFDNQW